MTKNSARGIYGNIEFSGTHDNVNGYSVQLTPSLGVDLLHGFSIEAGAPFYALASTSVTTTTTRLGNTATIQSNATGLLGDVYASVGAVYDFGRLNYKLTLKGTIPTGDTKSGISTGRATWSWSNHLETGKRISTYIDFGLANSLADTSKYHRSYTTLGYVAPLTAGLVFDLGHTIAFDASTYYDLPFGDQKLYSRVVRRNVSLPAGTRLKGRTALAQYFSQGGPSLAEDHGYSASFSAQPVKRLAVSVNYNRSIPDALDSVSATMSIRFGHGARKEQGE